MAKDKKSFLLYADLIHTVKHLDDDVAGKLFKHVLMYVNDKNPVSEHILVKVAFEPIKQSLKRDLEKYEEIKEKRSQAGQASAAARARKRAKEEQNPTKPTHVESVEQTSTNPTVSVSVSVSDSVNDILLEKETKEVFSEWLEYRKEIKKPVKNERTLKSLAKKIQEAGAERSREAVELSIQNGWTGLFIDKIPKKPVTTSNAVSEKLKKYD